MASVRRRKQRSGKVVYQVRQEGAESRTFGLRRDADLYANELERRRHLGELYRAPAESLGAFLDAFVERKEQQGRRPKTVRSLKESKRALDSLATRPIPALRRAEVEDLLAELAERAPRRAQMATALLKQALRVAQSRGQRVDETIFRIERPRYDEREHRFLTVEQVWALTSWLPDFICRIVPVAAFTGMRQGELFDLEDGDVDLGTCTVQVRGGKTKAARRSVSLADEVVVLLREQLMVRAAGASVVFPTSTGLRWISSNFMADHFRPATESADLEGFTFHMLRHTYVSLMIQAGVDVRTIAAQIGHADGGALLLRRYGHLYPGAGATAAQALDALVKGAAPAPERVGGE